MRRKVWIVLIGVLVVATASAEGPPRPQERPPAEKPGPKKGGTENDPLIQLEVACLSPTEGDEALLAALNSLPWASRTAVLPDYPGVIARDRLHTRATAVAALCERQWAD